MNARSTAAFGPLRQRWSGLAPRERRLVAIALAVVGAALLWWLAIGPALATLGSAAARHQALDAQLLRMRGLQAQAEQLKSEPRQGHEESVRALEAATRDQLGNTARLVVAGDRATLTLSGTPAGALAQWFTQARVNARALPAEARLTRNAAGAWDGTLVVSLPPR
ncbi:type II secretion system protein GspM [Ramlibacter rhizophilus]|uniref:Type II secretion system protein M n=1 Tax=Ramlibacter rhizophilus TaxID=1781167 RepID=A0A4Z0BFY0_9BURK|nr:type II secretion system protein GspM [Ramlibacter rhizophilus]TFY97309.1 type II secretion system protein M [Ramlibacter rhizophilus]